MYDFCTPKKQPFELILVSLKVIYLLQDSEHLAVYLRIKNTFKPIDKHYEFNNKELTCKLPSGSVALKNMREGDTVLKTFKFSKIYGPDTNQTDLFNSIVKKRMLDFINGRSGTLLTYGASGAGITLTYTKVHIYFHNYFLF